MKKNVLCEKGDEITRFDGMVLAAFSRKPYGSGEFLIETIWFWRVPYRDHMVLASSL